MLDYETTAIRLHELGHSLTFATDGDVTSYLVHMPDGSEAIVTDWPLGVLSVEPAPLPPIAENYSIRL